jgi:hypothetical protein
VLLGEPGFGDGRVAGAREIEAPLRVGGFGFRAAGDLRAFDRPSAGIGHSPPDIEKKEKKKKSGGHETFPLETFAVTLNVEEPVS